MFEAGCNLVLVNFHELLEPEVAVREVRKVAPVRVNHLSEVAGVNRHCKLKLLCEGAVEINYLITWYAQRIAMLQPVKLLLKQNLSLFINLKIRHFSFNLTLSTVQVVRPSFKLLTSNLFSARDRRLRTESSSQRYYTLD